MKNIHDNPVGIIKKSIYVIKNDINNKVYIGQAKNPDERFKGHCKNKNSKEGSIDYAINKFGKEHFYYSILESDIENYNKQEIYWIKKLNSRTPNGYNIQKGGDEPPCFFGIESPNASIKTMSDLEKIIFDIKNTNIPLETLAKKYNTNKKTIVCINRGTRYKLESLEYPLRKIKNISNDEATKKKIIDIINLLKNTYLQYEDICKKFNVSIKTIKSINYGKSPYHINGEDYPIRKSKISGKVIFTYEEISEIHRLLKETNISNREIARKFGVSHGIINMINSGTSKKYRRENFKYPIRKF